MLHCPKCQTEVPGGESYCPKCFEPVEQPKPRSLWRRFVDWLSGPRAQAKVHLSGFQHIEYVDPADGQRKQAKSFADIPESLRPQFEALQKQLAEGSVGDASTAFVFRDFGGGEHTYKSVDEMPPEVRSLYEQIRKLAEGKLAAEKLVAEPR
jgi:hypothetical protein